MITFLTAMTIAGNYPDNIRVDCYEENEKFGFWIYLLRNGTIHQPIVSIKAVYETKNIAKDTAQKVIDGCIRYVDERKEKEIEEND